MVKAKQTADQRLANEFYYHATQTVEAWLDIQERNDGFNKLDLISACSHWL